MPIFWFRPMCPYCRQNAPLVYRGVVPYCTACGNVRAPLTARSVTHAGKPKEVGGTVANAFGWVVLAVGTALALGLGGLAWAIFTVTAALVVFLPIELVAIAVGLLLVKGGKHLKDSGSREQKDARLGAITALAQTRGGILTASDVARATDMRPDEADALLTDLAKTQSDLCSLEVDDQGQIFYRFANAPWMTDPRVNAHVRVDAGGAQAPQTQGPRVVDAELIDEDLVHKDGQSAHARQKAR